MLTYQGGLPKKVKRIEGKGRSTRARKVETDREMVSGGFRLDLLLETARLALSTYYYQLKQLEVFDKDKASTIACLIVKELKIDFHSLLGAYKIFLHYYYQIDFD